MCCPRGDADAIRAATLACARELAPDGTGLLLGPSHRMQSDIPAEQRGRDAGGFSCGVNGWRGGSRRVSAATPTVWSRAPGRVDLMGSHTDYNLGYVLTLAISRDTWVAARPRQDGIVRLYSANLDALDSFDLGAIPVREGTGAHGATIRAEWLGRWRRKDCRSADSTA